MPGLGPPFGDSTRAIVMLAGMYVHIALLSNFLIRVLGYVCMHMYILCTCHSHSPQNGDEEGDYIVMSLVPQILWGEPTKYYLPH